MAPTPRVRQATPAYEKRRKQWRNPKPNVFSQVKASPKPRKPFVWSMLDQPSHPAEAPPSTALVPRSGAHTVFIPQHLEEHVTFPYTTHASSTAAYPGFSGGTAQKTYPAGWPPEGCSVDFLRQLPSNSQASDTTHVSFLGSLIQGPRGESGGSSFERAQSAMPGTAGPQSGLQLAKQGLSAYQRAIQELQKLKQPHDRLSVNHQVLDQLRAGPLDTSQKHLVQQVLAEACAPFAESGDSSSHITCLRAIVYAAARGAAVRVAAARPEGWRFTPDEADIVRKAGTLAAVGFSLGVVDAEQVSQILDHIQASLPAPKKPKSMLAPAKKMNAKIEPDTAALMAQAVAKIMAPTAKADTTPPPFQDLQTRVTELETMLDSFKQQLADAQGGMTSTPAPAEYRVAAPEHRTACSEQATAASGGAAASQDRTAALEHRTAFYEHRTALPEHRTAFFEHRTAPPGNRTAATAANAPQFRVGRRPGGRQSGQYYRPRYW